MKRGFMWGGSSSAMIARPAVIIGIKSGLSFLVYVHDQI